MAQLNHVYEDFVPTTEWLRDAGHDTLLVYLPGFKKEQLKVQVTSTQDLKIFGERPLGDNKFSRFRKELRIPLNYDSNKITAKFEGGILKIKHPKSIRPATKLQENANSSVENQELQKPAKEVKDQKHGQEQAAQEVPQKNKIENEKKTNGNNINENIAASKKEKELRDANGKNITTAIDANDVSGKFSNNEKTDGLVEEGKIVSNKHEKGQEITGSGESKLVYYKQVFGGLVTEMKKPRKSTNMVVAAGLLVLLLGFYVKSTIKSGESEN